MTPMTNLSPDDRHAAFVAGLEYGLAEQVKAAIEDEVLARLHDQARAALGMAKRYAAAKGPHWAQMIAECGERP